MTIFITRKLWEKQIRDGYIKRSLTNNKHSKKDILMVKMVFLKAM